MILAVIVGIWVAVVALVVAFDAIQGYLSDQPAKAQKATPPTELVEAEVKNGITAERHLKKIELGLSMMSKRKTTVVHPRGAHRRLQAT